MTLGIVKKQHSRKLVWAGVAALALMLQLTACAPAPTPYQAAAGPYGFGYSEQQIEQNRYRVTFKGNADTPRQQVENGLLYRAAQLTKANGFDYFIVVTQNTEPQTRYVSTFEGFGGYGHYHHSWISPGFDTTYGESYPVTNYSAFADIFMMKGRKDMNDVKAFSADDVMQKLGPVIYWGKAATVPGSHP